MSSCRYIALSGDDLHKNYKIKKYKKYSWLWNLPISADAKGLYEHLRMYSRNGWCAWPKQETLAETFGCHVKSIQRRIKVLIDACLIKTAKIKISGVLRQTYVFMPHLDMPDGEKAKLAEAYNELTATRRDSRLQVDNCMKNINKNKSEEITFVDETIDAIADMLDRARRGDKQAIKQIVEIHDKMTKIPRDKTVDLSDGSNGQAESLTGEQRPQDTPGDKMSPSPIYKGNFKKEEKQTSPADTVGAQSLQAPDSVDLHWSPDCLSDPDWIAVRERLYRDERLSAPVRGCLPGMIGKVEDTNKEKRLILYCSGRIIANIVDQHLPADDLASYGFSRYETRLQSQEQQNIISTDYFQREEEYRNQIHLKKLRLIKAQDNLPPEEQFRILLSQYPRRTKNDTEALQVYVDGVRQKQYPSLSDMISILQHWRIDSAWREHDGKYIPGIKRYLDENYWKQKIHVVC